MLLFALVAASRAAAEDCAQLAVRLLSSVPSTGAAHSAADPAVWIACPDLADAVEYLAKFDDEGRQTPAFDPPAPEGLTVTARSGGGIPRHWILVNASPADYAGRVQFPDSGKTAVGYAPLWAAAGAAWLPQTAVAGETALELKLPAGGCLALRPVLTLPARQNAAARITTIRNEPLELELGFELDGAAATALAGAKVTAFLEPRSELLSVRANNKGAVSFAPMTNPGQVRPIPFKLEKVGPRNQIAIKKRPHIWINLDPAQLAAFPFHKRVGDEWRAQTLVCIDDEATDADKAVARRFAESFAAADGAAGSLPRPALSVVTRAQADGVSGPIPKGGPHRVSIGPRDSLLFPGFGFQPAEKLHVGAGGALASIADDPDDYKVLYIVGVNADDRARVVYRLLNLLREHKAVD